MKLPMPIQNKPLFPNKASALFISLVQLIPFFEDGNGGIDVGVRLEVKLGNDSACGVVYMFCYFADGTGDIAAEKIRTWLQTN